VFRCMGPTKSSNNGVITSSIKDDGTECRNKVGKTR